MSLLRIFYTFAVFFAINAIFIGAECDSCGREKEEKKEGNIYTKEANEGDFKHDGDEKGSQEDNLVVEEDENEGKVGEKVGDKEVGAKEEEEKMDPEKIREVMKLIRQLSRQLDEVFGKSFDALENAITEIDKAFLNVTANAEMEIVKIEKEKGKDLSDVKRAVKSTIDKAVDEFGEYRKILRKNQEESAKSSSTKNAVEINSDLSQKVIIKMIGDEVHNMLKSGDKMKEVMNDMPEELDLVIEKTQIVLREKLKNFEKTLDVDLSSVKKVSEKTLKEISTSVTTGFKQTSGILAITLNTLLGLAGTLKAAIK